MNELAKVGQEAQVPTAPEWNERWGISREAALHLWELAASYILELEDSTHNPKITKEQVWKMLHERHPEWYPARIPHTLRDFWWNKPEWKQYLALRRQEHLLRTMPARLQIQRYYSHMQSVFGNMLLERALTDPDSFSNNQILNILKEVNSVLMQLSEDKAKAAGEETGQTIKIDVFQFLEKLPRERQNVIIGKLVRERVRPALKSGEDG